MSFITRPLGAVLNILFPTPKPPSQSLGDISQQTAKDGEPRVIVYGRVRPIGGNLIHCQTPVVRWVKVKQQGGKGGGSKSKAKEQRIYRTYAMGVCEGPITSFVRIWRNGKLVYDARGNAWGDQNNPVFLQSFRLYTGAWAQLPDPTLESIWGVGNVPAYRGTAYMVSIGEDLTSLGGSIPQWQFEVARAEGTFLTSRPYAIEDVEEMTASAALKAISNPDPIREEMTAEGAMLTAGAHKEPLVALSDGPEQLSAVSAALAAGAHKAAPSADPGIESLSTPATTLTAGVFRVGAVNYADYSPEAFNAAGSTLEGGSHAS